MILKSHITCTHFSIYIHVYIISVNICKIEFHSVNQYLVALKICGIIFQRSLNFTQLGALLQLLSCCHEVVNTRAVSLPQVALGLQCVIVAFAAHSHYFCLCIMHWIASHLNNGLTPEASSIMRVLAERSLIGTYLYS